MADPAAVPGADPMAAVHPWIVPLALAALFLLSFVGLGRGLWTPDEPREAEIAREMLLAPSVIPTLNGESFMEKPPLYYWTVALAYGAAGGPSATAARLVSVLASFGTVLVVFLWGRRAASTGVGLAAAVMLSTGLQFLLTGHWVLMDPFLMLFTTLAVFCAYELLAGDGGGGAAAGFYGSLALALWTKGLIGPVLVGAGLGLYLLVARRFPWRDLRMGTGVVAMLLALGALAFVIYREGGYPLLREWAWVNHVQRFLHPEGTGHDQPLPYYLWTLPFALLPWLVPLADALRPARWRAAVAGAELRRYCGLVALGMLVLLSASATKRGTYLMPVLPVLCLALAVNVADWARRTEAATSPGRAWGLQAVLVAIAALAPPVAALAYLRRPDALAVVFVALALACGAMLLAARRKGGGWPALAPLAITSLVAGAGALALAPRVLDREKDLVPFMTGVDRVMPPGEPVTTVGADETLLAIVPFATGRRVNPLPRGWPAGRSDAGPDPEWLLVQTKVKKDAFPDLPDAYERVAERTFGPGRHIALWHRVDPAGSPATP